MVLATSRERRLNMRKTVSGVYKLEIGVQIVATVNEWIRYGEVTFPLGFKENTRLSYEKLNENDVANVRVYMHHTHEHEYEILTNAMDFYAYTLDPLDPS